MARETSFTPEIGDKICSLLMEGRSLRSICTRKKMPAISTVMAWLAKGEKGDAVYKPFLEQYAHAREAQGELLVDEIIGIADKGSGDVQRDRLSVDTRKWYAGKMKPKKYGDKIAAEITGKDGQPFALTFTAEDQALFDMMTTDSARQQ